MHKPSHKTLVFLTIALLGTICIAIGAWYITQKQVPVPVVNTNTNTQPTEPVTSGIVIPPTKTDCTDELDTECWNTYRNEEYGFSFKFPEDIILESSNQVITFRMQKNNGYYFSIFPIDNFKTKTEFSFNDARDLFGYEKIYSIEDKFINQAEAKRIFGSGSGAYPEGDIIVYFFTQMKNGSNLAFKIGSINGGTLDSIAVDIYEKMLKSLAFVS